MRVCWPSRAAVGPAFIVLNNTRKTRWRLDVVTRLNIMPKFKQHEELSGQISASGLSLNVVKYFFITW